MTHLYFFLLKMIFMSYTKIKIITAFAKLFIKSHLKTKNKDKSLKRNFKIFDKEQSILSRNLAET